MNTFLLSALCLLWAWAALAGGVTVQEGESSFSLESVKKLKDLRELQAPSIRNRRKADGCLAPILCRYPNSPEELKPICQQPGAQQILQRPETIAQDPSMCEICAYAACAGCWDRWCSLPSAPPLQDAPSSRSSTYLPPNQERAAWGGPAPDPIRAARCFPRATPTLT
ncbi:PREDICTED: guanylin [Ceratotherium simum simum]|uniref:Guanylin n=1 Tax=Ceratotherium simum simum TaxID=73337 RepID=A0ABM0I9H4_CERSS|nr:PREDICTED: guanylin [Ceratotherium simum simum]